jgi:hypothetical protein
MSNFNLPLPTIITVAQSRLGPNPTNSVLELTYRERVMLSQIYEDRMLYMGTKTISNFETTLFHRIFSKDILRVEPSGLQKKLIEDTRVYRERRLSLEFDGGLDGITGEMTLYRTFDSKSGPGDIALDAYEYLFNKKLLKKSFSKELQALLKVASQHVDKIVIASGVMVLEGQSKKWISVTGLFNDEYSFHFTNMPLKTKTSHSFIPKNYFSVNGKTDNGSLLSKHIPVKQIRRILQEKISDEAKEDYFLGLFDPDNLFTKNIKTNEKNNLCGYTLNVETLEELMEVA